MAVTETRPPEAPVADGANAQGPSRRAPGELEHLIGTGDHTAIGRMYIGFSLMLIVASVVAMLITGLDSATDNGILGVYAAMLSTSALVSLVFLGVIPLLLGVATIIVPLQIGSPAIAFPRASALALWSWLVSSAIFITSIALDGGVGGGDYDASLLGNLSLGALMLSLGLGAVCVATTVVTHRPPGLSLSRVPLFSWSMLLASSIWIVTFGSAAAYTVIGHLQAETAPALLDNFAIGLGWLLRGPAVYMLAIPVLGIAGDAVASAVGRPLSSYRVLQSLLGAFAIFSFGAWAQAPRSVDTLMWALWALALMLVVFAFFGALLESMRRGEVLLGAPVIGALLSLVNLIAAAVIGLLMALDTVGSGNLFDFDPIQLGRSQTVFVITAALVGALAGIAHWSPQIWGAARDDSMASASLAMVDVGGGILAVTMAVEVFVQSGGKDTGDAIFGGLEAAGALVLAAGVIGSLVAHLGAAREGAEGDGDQADSGGLTLEWQVGSPAVGGERTAGIPEISSPYPLEDPGEDS